jgi:hypothetical protein
MDSGAADPGELWVELGRDRSVRASQLPAPLLACVTLIDFMNHVGGRLIADTTYQQLIVGTVSRSFATFTTIVGAVYDEKPIQGTMLCRPLFEDVVVTHWLLYNHANPNWLIERFGRHKEAMALYQQKLTEQTDWSTGPPLIDNLDDAKSRQNALFREFGGEAQKNWWDPDKEGEGKGKPIGLRGVAAMLEDAAAREELFHPRFAGGDEPLMRRMEMVISKWFTQCMHHTALGLPIDIPGRDRPPVPAHDRRYLLTFSAYWLFAQQVYALHDLYGRASPELDRLIYDGMKDGFGAPEETLHLRTGP